MNLEAGFEIQTLSTTLPSTFTSTLTTTEQVAEKSSTIENEIMEVMNITSRFDGGRILAMPEYIKDISLLTLFGILVLKLLIDFGCFLRRKRQRNHPINLTDLSSGSSQSILNTTKFK